MYGLELKDKVFKKAFTGAGGTTALHVELPSLTSALTYWILTEDLVEHASVDESSSLITVKHIGENEDIRKSGIPVWKIQYSGLKIFLLNLILHNSSYTLLKLFHY